VGSVLHGRYRLDQLLGRGGMGTVWRAQDLTLDLSVAVKVVNDLLARDAQVMAFLRDEARTAIPLNHQHIVRVNHFEANGPVTFLVMEYVEGESLAVRLARERRLPESEVRRVGLAIAEAIAFAHEHRVLHRDVKPANVLLGPNGAIKLADFGIARAVSDSLSRLTGVQTSGTLLYMSPEVIEGEPSTPAADWYALGATLYELVTGRPPFHTGDLTHQILHKTAKPLEGVSDELAELVAGLLSKAPEKRPLGIFVRATLEGSMERTVTSLPERRVLETDTVPAPTKEAATVRRARDVAPPAARRWRPWHVAVAAAVPLAIGIVFAVNSWRPAAGATDGPRPVVPPPTTLVPPADPTPTVVTATPVNEASPTAEPPPTSAPAPAALPSQSPERGPSDASTQSPSVSATPPSAPRPTPPELGIQWVRIPVGTFNMGCTPFKVDFGNGPSATVRPLCPDHASPRHAVTLTRAYDLMATEVTIGMYRVYAEATNTAVRMQPDWSNDARLPVVNINWNEAVAFCRWVGGRLPTEAEWERAARGGFADGWYPWGTDAPVTTPGAPNGARFGSSSPVVVASYGANRFGVFDMAGNVEEWVSDRLGAYRGTAPLTDPRGPSSGPYRVIKGGGYPVRVENMGIWNQAAYMHDVDHGHVGVRCAR
jgi:serine/threonine-protein kinase